MLLLVSGCMGIGPQESGPTEVRTCTTAAEAWILLERIMHHGGDAEFWRIDDGGNSTLIAARPTRAERTEVAFVGAWTDQDQDRVCEAMAAFAREDPHTGGVLHHSVRLVPQDVHDWRVDPARVGQAIGGFFSLDPDSSAGCLSGGDTWMRVDNGSVHHAVEATCAPDAAFQEVLAAFFEAVNRRPGPDGQETPAD